MGRSISGGTVSASPGRVKDDKRSQGSLHSREPTFAFTDGPVEPGAGSVPL